MDAVAIIDAFKQPMGDGLAALLLLVSGVIFAFGTGWVVWRSMTDDNRGARSFLVEEGYVIMAAAVAFIASSVVPGMMG